MTMLQANKKRKNANLTVRYNTNHLRHDIMPQSGGRVVITTMARIVAEMFRSWISLKMTPCGN